MVTAMRTSNLTWAELPQDKVQNFRVHGDESATARGRPRKQNNADADGRIRFV
jgi:hypothetical protein